MSITDSIIHHDEQVFFDCSKTIGIYNHYNQQWLNTYQCTFSLLLHSYSKTPPLGTDHEQQPLTRIFFCHCQDHELVLHQGFIIITINHIITSSLHHLFTTINLVINN